MSKDKHRARDSLSPHTVDPPHKRYHTVTQEKDGTFVCNCHRFGETGEMGADIVAAHLYDEFGHSGDYLKDNPDWNPFDDTESNASDSEQTTTPQIKVSSGCPAAVKPLQKRKSPLKSQSEA
ncbi:hypothetical protein B0H14DRAFT_2562319 [Mycena olivaceomarginata]|nr:hypothetical protein B0H14DRAFT_2562319 [Mycena olivaceomarginata]